VKKLLMFNSGMPYYEDEIFKDKDYYNSPITCQLTPRPDFILLHSVFNEVFDVDCLDLELELGIPGPTRGCDISSEDFLIKGLDILLSKEFDILAFPCHTSGHYLSSKFFAEEIKKYNKDILIVIGGYHPNNAVDDFLYDDSPFDHVVLGDVYGWMDYIEQYGFDIGNNRVIKSNKDYPMPISTPPHKIPYYATKDTHSVGMYLSKGCLWVDKCSFCAEFKKDWVVISVEESLKLVEEIILHSNPQRISFNDALFGQTSKWRKSFLRGLKLLCDKLEWKGYFWIGTRTEILDDEDIQLLSELNIEVDFGTDSLSVDMLKIMNKTYQPNRYLNKLLETNKKLVDNKIKHRIYVIINHPGETIETLNQLNVFMEKNIDSFRNKYTFISFSSYIVYPGTLSFSLVEKYKRDYGTIFGDLGWWKRNKNQNFYSRLVFPSSDFILPAFQKEKKKFIGFMKDSNQYSYHLWGSSERNWSYYENKQII